MVLGTTNLTYSVITGRAWFFVSLLPAGLIGLWWVHRVSWRAVRAGRPLVGEAATALGWILVVIICWVACYLLPMLALALHGTQQTRGR